MKKLKTYLDIFVLSGFISSFFYGFLNPLYISVILSRLDPRVIAVGSLMSSAFPVLIGAVLGNKRLFRKMYALLPALMLVQLIAGCAAALIAAMDLAASYMASMVVLGVFSTSIVFLLQTTKEKRYRGNRASFDRRCAVADSLGAGAGSLLAFAAVTTLRDPVSIAFAGALQDAVVYALFLVLYRRIPAPRGRQDDEDPHPRAAIEHCRPLAA